MRKREREDKAFRQGKGPGGGGEGHSYRSEGKKGKWGNFLMVSSSRFCPLWEIRKTENIYQHEWSIKRGKQTGLSSAKGKSANNEASRSTEKRGTPKISQFGPCRPIAGAGRRGKHHRLFIPHRALKKKKKGERRATSQQPRPGQKELNKLTRAEKGSPFLPGEERNGLQAPGEGKDVAFLCRKKKKK